MWKEGQNLECEGRLSKEGEVYLIKLFWCLKDNTDSVPIIRNKKLRSKRVGKVLKITQMLRGRTET